MLWQYATSRYPDLTPQIEALPDVELVFESVDDKIYRYRIHNESAIDGIIKKAGEPIISSHYDVYLHENRLIYAKDAQVRDDPDTRFFLHIIPANANDLPGHSRSRGYDNLDFGATNCVSRSDGKCVAVIELPGYDISQIRTGQYRPYAGYIHFLSGKPPIWEGVFDFHQ